MKISRSRVAVVLASFFVGCSGGDDASSTAGPATGGQAGASSAGAAGTAGKGGPAGASGKSGGGGNAVGGNASAGKGGAAGAAGAPGGAGGNVVAGSAGQTSAGAAGNSTAGAAGNGTAGAAGSGTAGNAAGGSAGVGGAGGGPGPLGGWFRHGMNMGAPPNGWTDQDQGWLGAQTGIDSNRIVLPEYFLEKWGVGIRTDAAKSYEANGLSDVVCFLIGPSAQHSTAPAGTPEWQLDYYIAKNLYEPIFAQDGSVNPNNHWAAYVAQTVTTYKPWIHIWEVWNEPDWVPDWHVTQQWATDAPKKADLPRFNGSIHDYVRMLRITTEVAKKIDPSAKIALGGIGYPTFLSAILRYTDEPTAGAVSADFPQKGGAYFDVLNMHYYPVFGKGGSDAGVDGFFALRDEFQAELTKAGVTGKTWNATETGAPRLSLGGAPGGPDYARNYYLKVMLRAQAQGFLGVDWFTLSDGAKDGQSSDPFRFMGLYTSTEGLAKKEDAVRSDTGWAATTLGKWWKGSAYDATKTAALSLPAGVEGGVYQLASGKTGVALWARGTDEAASSSYALAAAGPVTVIAWDHAKSAATTTIAPNGGKATIPLGSAPVLVVLP